jgi:hypothetical protein
VFLPIPAGIFDFPSLSFHVPMCAFAPKQAAVAITNRAIAATAIRVFIMTAIPSEVRLAVNSNSISWTICGCQRPAGLLAKDYVDWRRPAWQNIAIAST